MSFKEWLESKTLAWALSVDTVVNMQSAWNASREIVIDEAVKVVEHDYLGCDEMWVQDGIDLTDKIKELKN